MDDLFVATMSLILLPIVLVIIAMGLIVWFPVLVVMRLFGEIVGRWEPRGAPNG